jgi:23S rRNA maturation-related 3'-5' exoribonuclease YhaM
MKNIANFNDLTAKDIGKTITVYGALSVKRKADYVRVKIADDVGCIYASLYPNSKTKAIMEKVLDMQENTMVIASGTVSAVRSGANTANFLKNITMLEAAIGTRDNPYPAEEVRKGINTALQSIENKEVRKFVARTLKDVPNYADAPFSLRTYYSCKGGLIAYTYSMTKMLEAIESQFDIGSRDILVAAMLVHRIGKADQFSVDENGVITQTVAGSLNDDGIYTSKRVMKNIDMITDTELQMLLLHAIFTSKNREAWGAFTTPKTKEAKVLHYMEKIVLTLDEADGLQDAFCDEPAIVRGAHGEAYFTEPAPKPAELPDDTILVNVPLKVAEEPAAEEKEADTEAEKPAENKPKDVPGTIAVQKIAVAEDEGVTAANGCEYDGIAVCVDLVDDGNDEAEQKETPSDPAKQEKK